MRDNYGINATISGPIKKEFRTILRKENIPFFDPGIHSIRTDIINVILYYLTLLGAVFKSFVFLCRERPKLVLGTGSFGSFPACIAAFFLNIPVVIHEQNTVPGLANRVLGRFAKKVLLAFPNTSFPQSKIVLVGNPVNREIADLDKKTCYDKLGLDSTKKTLLIFGGSQGAFSVNSWFIYFLKKTKNLRGWQIIHITGNEDYSRIKKVYEDLRINALISPFLYPLDCAYEVSDLAVTRGGALSLSELSFWGIPALIIPYAYSKDNHQEYNALFFQKKGAAYLLKPKERDDGTMAFFNALLNDTEKLESMSRNMKKALSEDALEKICKEISASMN